MPTLTPTPVGPQVVDDYIVWKIGDKVSRVAETEVRSTVQAIHDFAVSHDLPRIDRPITIFLYHDPDSLAAAFEATMGRSMTGIWFWPELSQGKRPIVDGRDWIAVNTSASRYQENSSDGRRRSLAPHLFDLYRRALTGIWQGTPRDAVGPEGPEWLEGGSSLFLTYQATRSPIPESCDLTRRRYANLRGHGNEPLSELETAEGYYEPGLPSHPYGFLAVEVLADRAGRESLFAYYASLRTGVSWPKAFETAFGMTLGEFYELFEERRAAGFPEPGVTESQDSSMTGTFSGLLNDPGLPHYIKWDVGSEVDRLNVEWAVRAVKLMSDYAETLGLPDPASPITITIYRDMEKMACKYSMVTGWELELSRKYWANGGGVAGLGSVHISGSTPEQLKSYPYRMMRILLHELTHAHYQTGLTGFSRQKSGMSPRWLGEGTADLVTTLLLGENYPDALTQGHPTRAAQIAKAESSGLQPRDAEVWPPNEGGRIGVDEGGLDIIDCIYGCGYVAAELLASQVGMSRLFDYYKHVEPWMEPWDYAGYEENPRREWRIAFERAYGMTLEEFYELFEEHRDAGFPEVEIP